MSAKTTRIATIAVVLAAGAAAPAAASTHESGASRSQVVSPSPQVLREYVKTIQALYGPSRTHVRTIGMAPRNCR
jgi:hypothetical protein